MKIKSLITCLFLIIAPMLFGCKEGVKNGSNSFLSALSSGQKYDIDVNQSSITWRGSMLVGTNSHTGYVYFSGGTVVVNDGAIVGGTATVNMNTIEDESHERNNGLIDHLKAADFFDVEKFPVSTFAFTKGTSANKITGNLTIKGITHAVDFPTKMEEKDGIITATGKLIIDRTKWGVVYKSGKFYDLLADQTMSDDIEFQIKIVAKK
nr:YceI family protein [uncultured Flavobacterium sp.]